MTIKTCAKCNIKKVMEDDYYTNKRMKCGYSSYCIQCSKNCARIYNNTDVGRRKLYDIQAKRYQTKKSEGTLVNYYKPVPEDQKKKRGRKPISPDELERREKQKEYEKDIKQCNKLINKLINKLDIMLADTDLVIHELDQKVKNMMKETEMVINELDEKVQYVNNNF